MRNEREIKELKRPVRVAGLTGGIASGKTVATDALKNAGYLVIDADDISRELFGRGAALEGELCALFPAADKDDALDRRALRSIIAESAAERKKLNAFTHPKIVEEISRRIDSADNARIILSAPLLYESGLGRLCDCVVCLYAPRALRISRIVARDGVTRAEAEKILDAQMPDEYRATLADFCIPSDRPRALFEAEAVDLFDRIFD